MRVRVDQARDQVVPLQADDIARVDLRVCLCARCDVADPAILDLDTVMFQGARGLDRDNPVGMYEKVCLHESLPLFAISGIKYSKSGRFPYCVFPSPVGIPGS